MFFLSFFVSVAFLYSELWRALIFQKSIKIVSGCLGFFFFEFYLCLCKFKQGEVAFL